MKEPVRGRLMKKAEGWKGRRPDRLPTVRDQDALKQDTFEQDTLKNERSDLSIQGLACDAANRPSRLNLPVPPGWQGRAAQAMAGNRASVGLLLRDGIRDSPRGRDSAMILAGMRATARPGRWERSLIGSRAWCVPLGGLCRHPGEQNPAVDGAHGGDWPP